MSERRACQLVCQPRGTQRYQPTQREDEDRLTQAIVSLASQYGRYGYPPQRRRPVAGDPGPAHHGAVAAGGLASWQGSSRKNLHPTDEDLSVGAPVWRREGLKVPQKQKARGRLWRHDGSCVRLRPERKNHVWSYDFVSAKTHDGRTARMLNLIDEYTRECLMIGCERSWTSAKVISALADVMMMRGVPENLRSDNGPEFVAKDLRKWLAATGAKTLYIEPGSP